MGAFIDQLRGNAYKILAAALGTATLGLLIAFLIASGNARHWKKQFAGEQARHALTVSNYRKAAAEAHARDLAHAAAVQAQDAQIATETQNALEQQLADARALAARYAERMRVAPAGNQGGPGRAGVPSATGAAGVAPLDAGLALVPVGDLDICARNTVIARGWQDWWAAVSAAPR